MRSLSVRAQKGGQGTVASASHSASLNSRFFMDARNCPFASITLHGGQRDVVNQCSSINWASKCHSGAATESTATQRLEDGKVPNATSCTLENSMRCRSKTIPSPRALTNDSFRLQINRKQRSYCSPAPRTAAHSLSENIFPNEL